MNDNFEKNCTTCIYFEPLEGKFGHCQCPSSGGCESIVVEITSGCDMHKSTDDGPGE